MTVPQKSAADILQNHRIAITSSALGRYYATCPQCSSKRKKAHQKLECLGVTIDGEGVKFGCNHCDWTGGEYYRGTDRPGRIRTAATPIPTTRANPEPSELARIAQAVRMWGGGGDPRVSLMKRYLDSRRLELTDDLVGRVVRFDGASPWKNENEEIEYRPVMLLAFRSIADDSLVAVHRTLLSDDGRKLDRRMLGPAGGAAIKIDDDTEVEQGLHIGEGFETCLAGRQLGYRPAWALGSAIAIGKFPVLAGIDALTIFGETDDSGDNLTNAKACARRWTEADREAWLLRPNIAGDMNDVVVKS
jgi:putative DNA primase/helicase